MSSLPPFLDLHRLDEDARIDLIGRTVSEGKKTVGVCVDDEEGKPERYARKIRERFPGVRLESRLPGPVAGVVTLRFAPAGVIRSDPCPEA